MVKKIFFSGIKGGSGNTTLAVHFSNYVYFHMRKKVVLISFDAQNELTFLGNESPYPIIDANIDNIDNIKTLLVNIESFDIAVFDIPSRIEFRGFHQYADLILVTIEFMQLDLFKTLGFVNVLLQNRICDKNKIIMLPNKQDRYINAVIKEQFISQMERLDLINILPHIACSNQLRALTFSPLSKPIFYLLRPTFHIILKNVNFS